MPSRLIEILLVEDDPADVRLARETLKDYKMQNTLHVVEDGEQALAFLRKQGLHSGATTPDLILLDLNLPRVDGVEVIAAMQMSPDLRNIPVVVLAASPHDRTMLADYDVPADCFVVKPLSLERFLEAVRCFSHLGLSIVKIASATGGSS
jgi:two-component system, chemotaxis family, response regulator Rcp1